MWGKLSSEVNEGSWHHITGKENSCREACLIRFRIVTDVHMAGMSFKGKLESEPVLERTPGAVEINSRSLQQVIDQRPM